ncbi:MAG: hypothetical protein QXR84_03150 [Candidatus Bathyarchaeia archaeon]|nr:hypothetical protein [Candidatus Bathyarchaeota archaeon]
MFSSFDIDRFYGCLVYSVFDEWSTKWASCPICSDHAQDEGSLHYLRRPPMTLR